LIFVLGSGTANHDDLVRIGLIGAGNISDTHARAAAAIPGVAVAAVVGLNPEKTTALAERYGATPYSNLAAFLAHRPMDLVAIGSPSGLHAQQAAAAVQQGLHVIVEKPLDIDTDRIDALIAAADSARVKVAVFFQDRLKPATVELKRALTEGRLGTPVMASGRVKWYRPPEYYAQSRWRGTWALDGGGALMNQGIHTVDLLLWLFGPVARVRAATRTRLHAIEVEDTAVGILEFESGALGVIEATTSAYPGYARRMEVTGAEGTIVMEDDRIVRTDLRSSSGGGTAAAAAITESAASPVVSDASAHQRIIEDFIRAIQSGSPLACDASEGRRSVAVVQAIYEAARTGTTVIPR
jgi:UDP-N-acetyl-2-amino-2-deoxyglucuronate dehydrogenase